jgi:predicted phosphatase
MYHSKSCHTATNVNITHIFSSFLLEPPRGMYMYLQQQTNQKRKQEFNPQNIVNLEKLPEG